MILECANCGAPADATNVGSTFTCRYCGTVNQRDRVRTIATTVPPDFQPPKVWTPPAEFPADSNVTLDRSESRIPTIVAAVVAVLLVTVVAGVIWANLSKKSSLGSASGPDPKAVALARGAFALSPAQVVAQFAGEADGRSVDVRFASGPYDRITLIWDTAVQDHPMQVKLRPRYDRHLDDEAIHAVRDKLPGGFNQWFIWLYDDAEILFDKQGTASVRVEPQGDTKPHWRERFEAGWKLVMGKALGVSLEPTSSELALLVGNGAAAVAAEPKQAPPALDFEPSPIALTWTAVIRSSVGAAPSAGTSCIVTVKAHHGTKHPEEDFMTCQCGGKILYDSQKRLEGMSMSSFSLEESPRAGKVGEFEYYLHSDDTGARSGDRNQITIDTWDGTFSVFRDQEPSFKVKGAVVKKAPTRQGKALVENDVPLFNEVVSRKATVTASTGRRPFSAPVCDLRLSPGYQEKNTCRAQITCGGKVVFGVGTSGFEPCAMEDGLPVSLVDPYPTSKNQDPELSVDLKAKTATLGDTFPDGSSYSVSFKLE